MRDLLEGVASNSVSNRYMMRTHSLLMRMYGLTQLPTPFSELVTIPPWRISFSTSTYLAQALQ
jgi:hypothetical protein